jgi:hypothetical protein
VIAIICVVAWCAPTFIWFCASIRISSGSVRSYKMFYGKGLGISSRLVSYNIVAHDCFVEAHQFKFSWISARNGGGGGS